MTLSETDRDALLRAIESALEVRERRQFSAWLRGPFHALVPHSAVVGIELDGRGGVCHFDCLQGLDGGAAAMNAPAGKVGRAGEGESGACLDLVGAGEVAAIGDVAMRLANAHYGHPELPATVPARLFADLADAPGAADCLIHRARFVSGAAIFFVLFDVPGSGGTRCRHHLRILSSHLKMAWSRVIDMPVRAPSPAASSAADEAAAITEREREILVYMAQGKNNAEISTALGISPLTLKAHVRKIYRKLNVGDRGAAIARGLPGTARQPA